MKPTLSFIESVKICFNKYANFSGRARRSEYWWFYLLTCIPGWILGIMTKIKLGKVDELTNMAMTNYNEAMAQAQSFDTIFYIVSGICGLLALLLLIPSISSMARRLHDVGKSGHWIWCVLLCGIGIVIPLIMCIPDGKPEPNQYGPSPKYGE